MRAQATRPTSNRRLATVLTAVMTLLSGLTVTLITATDLVVERRLSREKLEGTGLFLARTLNDVVADHLYFRNIEGLRNLSNVVKGQPEIEAFMVLDVEGRVLTSGGEGKYPVGQIELPDWGLAGASPAEIRYTDSGLEMISPVTVNREPVGALLFRFDTGVLAREERAMMQRHLLQLLLLLALAAAASYVLARLFVKPVKQLVKATERIAAGDFDLRDESDAPGEIGELKRSVRRMAQNLRDQERRRSEAENSRLRESHAKLERSNLQLSSTLDELERARGLLDMIASIQREFIESREIDTTFRELLAAVLRITRSEYGFIAEVLRSDDGLWRLRLQASSGLPWTGEIAALYEGLASSVESYDAKALRAGSDLEAGGPGSTDLPEGHPVVETLLGVPIRHGGELIGQICVANREGGYPPDVVRDLEPLLATVGQILVGQRAAADRESLQAQLYQAQKMESLGLLAGGVAHDFNNLLSAILGNAELAMTGLRPESAEGRHVERIQEICERAADLAAQMLAYSGKGRFIVESVDLSTVVEDITHLLEVSVGRTAVMEFDLSADLPQIEGDITQLRQVIMNLITNASEAMGEDQHGVIRLRTGVSELDPSDFRESVARSREEFEAGTYVWLEVRDSGRGMDREVVKRMFDPFFSTKLEGRGLGMAATLGIMSAHGGAITVDSEPGAGTTVRCLLPANATTIQPAPQPAATQGELLARPGTVLVVDDEESVRSVLGQMVKRLGFDLLTAADGQEAIDTFRDHADAIDLVILDMTMPQVNGEEAFREIRRIRGDARVVLTSGYTEEEAIRNFAGKGLAGFLQKPFRMALLKTEIREVLGGASPVPAGRA